MSNKFSLPVSGPFSLTAVRELQCGFLRGSRTCSADVVKIAFPRDGSFGIVGVALRHEGSVVRGVVSGEGNAEAVGRQVARTLAIDCDGAEFARILKADPFLRPIAEARPGFRPVVSYSPYVMAGWAVLSQRMRMSQAAAIQVRIAEAVGDVIEVDGERIPSFPRPESLLALSGFPGVSETKWERLQSIARAALDGELEIERLMSRSYEESRARLMSLKGVGPWTADGVLIRGCGPTDLLPISEPMLHEAVQRTYRLEKQPDDAAVIAIAEQWRPFRTWVSVLLISEEYRNRAAGRRPAARGARLTAAQGR